VSERPPPLRESLLLPGCGRLELRTDERRVLYWPERGGVLPFDAHPIFGEPGRLLSALARDGRSLLLARHAGGAFHVFDAARRAFSSLPGFERIPRAEELRLHSLADGWLVLCESGVALLDARGGERWRIEGPTPGWQLLATQDGVLYLRDSAGDVRAVDERSGRDLDA
jgi:PQQ-like domain